MSKPKIPTLFEMELALAQLWGWRTNLIVPNVSWGMGIHECDIIVLSKSNWAAEIEIKRSIADLKKDATKKHAHDRGSAAELIKHLYFAIPEFLLPHEALIPQRAGIVVIKSLDSKWAEHRWLATIMRAPQANPNARKWTDRERLVLGRLGCMRIWSMKRKFNEQNYKELKINK